MELMQECLTKRSVETRTDFVIKPLSEEEVSYTPITKILPLCDGCGLRD